MNQIHFVLVLLSLLTVLVADKYAISWVFGKKELLNKQVVSALHLIASVLLSTVVLTGGLLFVDNPSYFISDSTFLIKLVFVAGLILNGFFIEIFANTATEKTYASLTCSERRKVLWSGAVSLVGWAGAFVCGLTLVYL